MLVFDTQAEELDEVQVIGKSEARRQQEQAYAISVLDIKKAYNSAAPLNKLLNNVSSVRIREEGGDKGFHKKGEWAKAAYWIVQNSNLTAGEGGAAVDLAFKTKYGDGSDAGLALQTDWGFDNPKNDGKVYQTSHLQKDHPFKYDIDNEHNKITIE